MILAIIVILVCLTIVQILVIIVVLIIVIAIIWRSHPSFVLAMRFRRSDCTAGKY